MGSLGSLVVAIGRPYKNENVKETPMFLLVLLLVGSSLILIPACGTDENTIAESEIISNLTGAVTEPTDSLHKAELLSGPELVGTQS